jgi:hypothetical protein
MLLDVTGSHRSVRALSGLGIAWEKYKSGILQACHDLRRQGCRDLRVSGIGGSFIAQRRLSVSHGRAARWI